MTLQEIEDAIVAQCELRRAEGWTIKPGDFGSIQTKTCCGLGAFDGVIEAWNNCELNFHLSKIDFPLGLTPSEANSFTRGFDGNTKDTKHQDHYLLGVRVRERLGL